MQNEKLKTFDMWGFSILHFAFFIIFPSGMIQYLIPQDPVSCL